jgi:hypothetical protein
MYQHSLEEAGVALVPGLTKPEIQGAQESYGFIFPPDLRDLLMFGLPVSKDWPNWRNADDPAIWRMLNWPYEGIRFDIQNNAFWRQEWGPKPPSLTEAFAVAKQKVDDAPKLIPVLGHRYLPDRPNIAGNPVFSVYQTDIIYYGSDLWNYLENEFYYYFKTPKYNLKQPIRRIEFWSDLVESNLLGAVASQSESGSDCG